MKENGTKRLLAISHASVTAVNQAFYADVARLSGWAVDLVIPARWDSEYTKNIEPTRWPEFRGDIHTVPVWKSGNIPLHVYKQTMIGLLRKVRPDIIYVHHEPYGAATAQVYLANRASLRVPIGFYAAQNILKRYPVPFRWLEQMVFRSSDFSFPVSEGALQVLREKGYTGVAEVLPLALDRKLYYPRKEWAEQQRFAMGIARETFVFGYLGRFVEEKGLECLLRAAAGLGDLAWRCLLIGNGPMEPKLRTLVSELGIAENVIFHAFVPHPEVPNWLSLLDVLMLPSETRPAWKEQFGRVIVEANACETAVIGTDSGEIGHVLGVTGGGLVVPEADPEALSLAMRDLLAHPEKARALALRGAEAVKHNYDQDLLATRFIQVLREALARKE